MLTGGSTISAGETCAQALMDRPGRTARIGEHTQGVFSDTLERDLPGGWRINVPNEEFRTRSGQSFDGPGILPHLYEPALTEEEFALRRDSAFDRGLRVLPSGGAPGAAWPAGRSSARAPHGSRPGAGGARQRRLPASHPGGVLAGVPARPRRPGPHVTARGAHGVRHGGTVLSHAPAAAQAVVRHGRDGDQGGQAGADNDEDHVSHGTHRLP